VDSQWDLHLGSQSSTILGPLGSADTRIAYPQQVKDGYPAGTNTSAQVSLNVEDERLSLCNLWLFSQP